MTTDTSAQPSGVDLARVALHAAREAARKNGGATESRRPRRRPRPPRRHADGRDPMGFGAVIQGLIADRAWEIPAAGGSAVDRWPSIAGEKLAAHVHAVRFRADLGALEVRADSDVWYTQLRLERPALLARFGSALGPNVVRDIVRSRPGPPPEATEPAPGPAPLPTPSVGPVVTRETASPGYRRALAAYLITRDAMSTESAPDKHAPRTPIREPVEAFAQELARRRAALSCAGSHAQALARARSERAERGNPAVADRTDRKGNSRG
ncbi:DciA family protein [Streptomyces sp. HK10]|uniref:DciA family protein n=1 Tax=Streptomyces sp. HK10 TaxID=3373255 RepID=UPI003749D479